METTKETTQKNPPLVTKPSIVDTLRAFAIGQKATYYAAQLGYYNSVYIMAQRLADRGEGKWILTPEDNGAKYTIERTA